MDVKNPPGGGRPPLSIFESPNSFPFVWGQIQATPARSSRQEIFKD